MAGEDLRRRTRQFGLRVIEVVESLPRGRVADVLGGQLLRAGTAVGANYRAACRAKSPADFISKMGTVEEELDESVHWLEVVVESRMLRADGVQELMRECDELLAITVSSINTARGKKRGKE
jgi:four helix bundle protein